MRAARFWRYELRTTDVDAARAFYAHVLGPTLDGPDIAIVPLPERARARGAPAHWLGHIGATDVDAVLRRALAEGAEQLGPTLRDAHGSQCAALRDPLGAVVAVTSGQPGPARPQVAWHVHLGPDAERGFALYAKLFGWGAADADLALSGPYRPFAWDASGRAAGAFASTAGLPRVHPQWLYFFGVADIDIALDRVRERGGLALETTRTARGEVFVPCDDPQGAAFGLHASCR